MPPNHEHPVVKRWNMRQRDWAVVLWIAFLTAAIGEVLLFGLIDPRDLVASWTAQYDIGERLTYGLGFAFLYLLCLLAAWLTMFMIRTGPQRGHAKGDGERPIPQMHDSEYTNPDLKDE